jgi:glycosyltransferase involved in cell wall biosynthesis
VGVRDRVRILWNANNTFCFDRIDWRRLSNAAVITTVSKYMKHLMRGFGVDALVIPNGLSGEALERPEPKAVHELRHRLRDRIVLAKVARWDPDKRWLLAVRTTAELKTAGYRPLLIARGGVEAHGAEVMRAAADLGLRMAVRAIGRNSIEGLLGALADVDHVDVVNLVSPLDAPSHRVLFRAASSVLANSGHEPFGLVGLEAMAAGGVACTGCSGEDYAVPGQNALVLQTEDPRECVELLRQLRANPAQERAIRRGGQVTARQYAWNAIVARNLVPRLRILEYMTPFGPRADWHCRYQ